MYASNHSAPIKICEIEIQLHSAGADLIIRCSHPGMQKIEIKFQTINSFQSDKVTPSKRIMREILFAI